MNPITVVCKKGTHVIGELGGVMVIIMVMMMVMVMVRMVMVWW